MCVPAWTTARSFARHQRPGPRSQRDLPAGARTPGGLCTARCRSLWEAARRCCVGDRKRSGARGQYRTRAERPRARPFVDALLQHLPRRMGALLGLGADGRAAGAAPAAAADARTALLRLLAQLLALAPQRALSPAAPASKFLLGFYVGVLELRRASSHERRGTTHHAWVATHATRACMAAWSRQAAVRPHTRRSSAVSSGPPCERSAGAVKKRSRA
jgi:hypothetical protein